MWSQAGGFNEMYGWDSYFIIRGLLRSGASNWRAAWSITFFFEVEEIMAPSLNAEFGLTI